jgi:hypothetical protein
VSESLACDCHISSSRAFIQVRTLPRFELAITVIRQHPRRKQAVDYMVTFLNYLKPL